MRKICFIISIIAFAVVFQSCNHLFLDENIFGDSAADRLAADAAHSLRVLQSAPNGWEMHYFPTNTQTGHVLLVQFHEDGTATMMGRNITTANRDSISTGEFQVKTVQSTVLSFNTKNPIIHAFSDPDRDETMNGGGGRGHGFQGDFEFTIINADYNLVHLSGVKRRTHVEMRPLPPNQDWSEHLDRVDEMRNYLFENNPLVILSVGDEQFSFSNGRNGVFVMPAVDENAPPRRIAFMATAEGITLAQHFVVGNDTIRRFFLNDDRTQLVAVDVNFDSRIQTAPAIDVFLDNMNNGNRYLVFGGSESMGADVNAVRSTIVSLLAAQSLALNFIGFVNSREFGASLVVQARVGWFVLDEGFLSFDISKLANNEVSFTFTGEIDEDGRNFYENYAGSQFVNIIEADTYSVRFQYGGVFAPSTFRFQGKNNPDVWFDLSYR